MSTVYMWEKSTAVPFTQLSEPNGAGDRRHNERKGGAPLAPPRSISSLLDKGGAHPVTSIRWSEIATIIVVIVVTALTVFSRVCRLLPLPYAASSPLFS